MRIRKLLCFALAAVLLALPLSALCESSLVTRARLRLKLIGFDVPDEAAEAIDAYYTLYAEKLSVGDAVRDLLVYIGAGDHDYDTFEWTPKSDRFYAFDAEVFDVGRMYTLFLAGIQAIVPDAVITDVAEDLSGMTEEVVFDGLYLKDGTRSVSFCVNSHSYQITLDSLCDWFNEDMLSFIRDVLKKENCSRTLYVMPCGWDQTVLLFYGDPLEKPALDAAMR